MGFIPLFFLGVIAFELFSWLRMSQDAMMIFARSQQSMRVLMASDMADEEKERLMLSGSAEIFKITLRFTAKFLLLALAIYGLFVLTVAIFPSLHDVMIASLYSPAAIALLTVGLGGYAWVRKAVLARR
jgi:hypothetical protein